MKAVKIDSANPKKEELIAAEVIKADKFFSKFFGLVIRRKLRGSQGFLIGNCSGIHTFWMRYNIDAVFLDKKNKVLAIYHHIKPFRATPFIRNSFYVLELKAGTAGKTSLNTGDLIRFEA